MSPWLQLREGRVSLATVQTGSGLDALFLEHVFRGCPAETPVPWLSLLLECRLGCCPGSVLFFLKALGFMMWKLPRAG